MSFTRSASLVIRKCLLQFLHGACFRRSSYLAVPSKNTMKICWKSNGHYATISVWMRNVLYIHSQHCSCWCFNKAVMKLSKLRDTEWAKCCKCKWLNNCDPLKDSSRHLCTLHMTKVCTGLFTLKKWKWLCVLGVYLLSDQSGLQVWMGSDYTNLVRFWCFFFLIMPKLSIKNWP